MQPQMRWSKIAERNLHGSFFAIVKVSEGRSRYDANGGGRDEYCVPSIAAPFGRVILNPCERPCVVHKKTVLKNTEATMISLS